MKQIKLTHGKYTIVNDEDFEWLNQWKWHYRKHHSGNSGYVTRTDSRKNNKKLIIMHRLIMGVDKNEQVDHINRDKLDNRRINLRIATKNDNAHNKLKYRNNTSGYKGVTWHKRSKKWYAQIVVNWKHVFLGMYDNAEDAYRAYKNASKKYFGKFSAV